MILDYFSTPHTREVETTHRNRKGEEWTTYEEKANPIPTMDGFADVIGVADSQLREWKERFSEFQAAYTRARSKYRARVNDLAARGFLNPAYSIFLAKNTMDYTDKQEVKHSGGMQHDHFFEGMLARAKQLDNESAALETSPVNDRIHIVNEEAAQGEGDE